MSTIFTARPENGNSRLLTAVRLAPNYLRLAHLTSIRDEKNIIMGLLKRAGVKGIHPAVSGLIPEKEANMLWILGHVRSRESDSVLREISLQVVNDAFSLGLLQDYHREMERALIELLGRNDDCMTLNAIDILARHKPNLVEEGIAELLRHGNPEVSGRAFEAVANANTGLAVSMFMREMENSPGKEGVMRMLRAMQDAIKIEDLSSSANLRAANRFVDLLLCTELPKGLFDQKAAEELVKTIYFLSTFSYKGPIGRLRNCQDLAVASQASTMLRKLERSKYTKPFTG